MMMKPLQIGNLCIDRPVILAPMAGVTDLPFRVLCREQGCGMVCTEMVSAKAITYKNKNTFLLMETVPQERPVSLQLHRPVFHSFTPPMVLARSKPSMQKFTPLKNCLMSWNKQNYI